MLEKFKQFVNREIANVITDMIKEDPEEATNLVTFLIGVTEEINKATDTHAILTITSSRGWWVEREEQSELMHSFINS